MAITTVIHAAIPPPIQDPLSVSNQNPSWHAHRPFKLSLNGQPAFNKKGVLQSIVVYMNKVKCILKFSFTKSC